MSDIKIIQKTAPKLKHFKMACDVPIKNPQKIKVDMLHRFNCASTLMVLGNPGSGKTTFVIHLLGNRDLFRSQFARMFIVSPPSSRASWNKKGNPLEGLPEERFYDEPTLDVLQDIEKQVKDVAELNKDRKPRDKVFSCVVLDDVQDYMKDAGVVRYLRRFAMNRRHNYCFLILICQNYLSLQKALRNVVNSVVFFNISKEQLNDLYKEYFTKDEATFYKMVNAVFTADKPNSWIMMTRFGEYFTDWNQIRLGGDDDEVKANDLEKKI